MLPRLRKILAHPVARQSLIWGSVYVGLAGLTHFLDPAGFPRWAFLAGAVAMLTAILGGAATAGFLASGRWSLERWRMRFIFASTLPWMLACAIWFVGAPQYAAFGLLLVPIGTLMGIGIFRARTMLAFGSIAIVMVAALTHMLGSGGSPWSPAHLALVAAVLLSFHLLLGMQSGYWLDREKDRGGLLRESRRNKRLVLEEREKSDRLLLNVLPAEVAEELKEHGRVEPRRFDSASVLFTDFQGFTLIAGQLDPEELIGELDRCFSFFDQVCERYGLEKLKTIGDSYMCAGGVPLPNQTHAVDCVLAALEIQAFMNRMKEIKSQQGLPYWELRLGIHSGPLVAGVIGEKKFAFDVWGDTVNVASRLESGGVAGRVNISAATNHLVTDFFECEYRGSVPAKHKGNVDMYFVNGILPELRRGDDPRIPNDLFRRRYGALQAEDAPTSP